MIEHEWQRERDKDNRAVIRSISFYRRIRPEFQDRVVKGIARREEKKAAQARFDAATMRCCGNCYCVELAHWSDSRDFPFRIVPNRNGTLVVLLPDNILPRTALEFHLRYGLETHVGSLYRYHKGRRCKGRQIWDWPADYNLPSWDKNVPCLFRFLEKEPVRFTWEVRVL